MVPFFKTFRRKERKTDKKKSTICFLSSVEPISLSMLDNWGAGLQGCHSYHYCCNAYNLIYVKKTNLHQRSKISAACVHSFRNDGKQQLLHMNNGFDKQNSSICWYYTKNCLVPE
jgi:hypothetical protein